MLGKAGKKRVILAIATLGCCAPALAQTKPRTVVANGYAFNYVEQGRGEPVVLVHGAVGDYRSAEAFADRLAAHYRVIRYSRRYHWPNAIPAQITDYSPELHARDLVEFLRALKLPPVHLVAHSYGGLVAVLAATSNPDLVRTLTVAEPATFSLIEGTPEMDMRRKRQAEITENVRVLLDAGKSAEAASEFAEWTRDNDGGFLRLDPAQRQVAYDNAATILPMLSAPSMAVPITCDALASFPKPVLALFGGRTRSWYRLTTVKISQCFHQASVQTIPDSTHFVEDDNPLATVQHFESFLAQHARDIAPQ